MWPVSLSVGLPSSFCSHHVAPTTLMRSIVGSRALLISQCTLECLLYSRGLAACFRALQVEGAESDVESVGREERRALYSPHPAPREEEGRKPGEGDQEGPVEGDHLRVYPHGHEHRDQAQVEPQEVQEGAHQVASRDLRPVLPGRDCLADYLLDLYGRRGEDHANQERRETEGGDDALSAHSDQLAAHRDHGEADDTQADGLRVRVTLLLGLPQLV